MRAMRVCLQCRADSLLIFRLDFSFYRLFTLLMGGDPTPNIVGIGAGHLYYFCVEVLPKTKGVEFIKTPEFLTANFGGDVPVMRRPGAPGAPAPPRQRHAWGGGNRLGGPN